MTDEELEKWAIRCARGNNGGSWGKHYTESQKEFWREYIRDLVKEIEQHIGNGR